MPTLLAVEKRADLAAHIHITTNFSIHTRTESLDFAVFAQYGGLAEPGTDICAVQIAGDHISVHTVVSCRQVWEAENGENRLVPRPLHNHPDGIALAEKCQRVVSVRARSPGRDSAAEVCVDGLDTALIASLERALTYYSFALRPGAPKSRARHPDNICNRGLTGRGVELDISHQLLSRLLRDPSLMTHFACAVRTGFHAILPADG